jgi:endonuclease YncB( thermonuclease family)
MILDGVSLRAELIRNGFAREYYGDAKQSWCQ